MARKSEGIDIGEGELIVLGLVAVGVWIFAKGGLANVFANAGEAAVDAVTSAASGAVTGVVGGIGHQVGLPSPSQLTDDPYIARWIIDAPLGGNLEASKWATSSAFINALTIDAGQGVAPPPNSPLWRFGQTIDFGQAPPGSTDGW